MNGKSSLTRPNDYFMEQIVDLDNDLRKHREYGTPRSIQLAGLGELKNLPKPWHYEFWSDPFPDDLPFELVHQSRPVISNIKRSLSSTRLASKRASMISNESSDWEWEYYDETEEEDGCNDWTEE